MPESLGYKEIPKKFSDLQGLESHREGKAATTKRIHLAIAALRKELERKQIKYKNKIQAQ